jgi:hypothetical protein
MKKIETPHGTVLISDFESALSASLIMAFNDDFIEVPGVVIFTKGNITFIDKILNPGVEIISVDHELFAKLHATLMEHKDDVNIIAIPSKTKPSKTILINTDVLKKQAVFARIIDDSITVNDVVFTNNNSEFHGDGMFTNKRVYFVNFEQLSAIRGLFKAD